MNTLMYEDDQTLIEAIRAGGRPQEEACKFLFVKHINWVKLQLGGQEYYKKMQIEARKEEEIDVFDDTFCSIKNTVSNPFWALTESKFSTYFYYCIRNEVWKRGKKYTKSQKEDPPQSTSSLSDEMVSHLREAIDHLGEPCRSVLVLFYSGGYKSYEIGEMLEPPRTDDWVRARLVTCRQKLKELLNNPRF